jgi:60S ribosome subunit biogenesis protein NIP7
MVSRSIGRNLKHLVDRKDDPHCFRVQKEHVYYVRHAKSTRRNTTSEKIMKLATSVGRKQLLSLGVRLGKFTKTGKFRLQVTAMPILAQYAQVWTGCGDDVW